MLSLSTSSSSLSHNKIIYVNSLKFRCVFNIILLVTLFYFISTHYVINAASDANNEMTCDSSEQTNCIDIEEKNSGNIEETKKRYLSSSSGSKLKRDKWQKYLNFIGEATKNYKSCAPALDPKCDCHFDQIKKDLRIFEKDGIEKKMLKQAKEFGTHYQIINHTLYRHEKCIFPMRCAGVEHFILEIIQELPDMEFILNDHDWPKCYKYKNCKLPVLSFSKTLTDHNDILYPAWAFWGGGPCVWPIYKDCLGRWDLQRKEIPASASKWPWERKKNIAFFRGSRTSAERDPLIYLSISHPNLVHARYTDNQSWRSKKDTLDMEPVPAIPLSEHCDYKYLFNFRGVAASFRLRHLFLCDSLVFHVGDEWIEFFYPALKPWVHYIPVKKDLSDAKILIEFAQQNDEIVRKIAERGRNFIWNHLRMKDVSCYWKRLLTNYGKLLKYRPKLNKKLKLRNENSPMYYD